MNPKTLSSSARKCMHGGAVPVTSPALLQPRYAPTPAQPILSLNAPGNERTDRMIKQLKQSLRTQLQDTPDIPAHYCLDAMRIGVGEPLQSTNTIAAAEVTALAVRIADENHVNAPDVRRLLRAFLQDAENIGTFLNNRTVLAVLVRELTHGNDGVDGAAQRERQLLAVECLCNLALGSDESGRKVAAAAARPLVALLDDDATAKESVQTVALWTLSNMYASELSRAAIIVHGLGVVQKLLDILCRDVSSEELKFETLLALNVMVTQNARMLSLDESTAIIDTLVAQTHFTAAIPVEIVYRTAAAIEYRCGDATCTRLTGKILAQLISLYNAAGPDTVLVPVVYMLRMLGNLFAVHAGSVLLFVKQMRDGGMQASSVFNRVIRMDAQIALEVQWVAGNVYTSKMDEVQEYLEDDDFRSNLLDVMGH